MLEDLAEITLVLTNRCNLRCAYCYQERHGDAEMSEEVARRAVALLLASSRPRVTLAFNGGEPLLAFRLLRRVVRLVERWPTPRPRVEYRISTNGTLLDPRVARFLDINEIHTQLSFDGPSPAQEVRGPGTFEVLDHLLRRLRRYRPAFFERRLGVALVAHSSLVPSLADSVAYFLGIGVTELVVYPPFTHDPGWHPGLEAALDHQMSLVAELSRRHFERTGRVPLMLLRKHRTAASDGSTGDAMCGVGDGHSLTVDVNGQVVGCVSFATSFQRLPPYLGEAVEPLRLGDVRDADLAQRLAAYKARVAASRMFAARSRKRSSYGSCAECPQRAGCVVCPVAIGHIPGNVDPDLVPDHLCTFNRVVGAWRERFPAQPHPLDGLLGRAPLPPALARLRADVGVLAAARRRAPTPG
jgi:sulfatase maturation enzyme AslB (radical SAM superfamily)